jgi:NAD dependent epimerase/dehydratase family enzyme
MADQPRIPRMNQKNETLEAEGLIDTPEVALRMKVCPRTVQNLVARKAIPVVRLSPRCVRFSWPDIQAALSKFTVKEVA